MSDIVKALEGIDHGSVEDCFLQSPLFAKTATEITRLRSDLEKAREALEKIADEAPRRIGCCQTDITFEPLYTADEAQSLARKTLKEIDNERT